VSGPVRRSGMVALAGRPNVGKSTLVNRMVGEHVAAVSERPQTTRRRVLGAAQHDDAQVVLVDLPGFQRPFDRLTERMQRSVDETLQDVDAVMLVLDATDPIGPGDRHIAERVLGGEGPPAVIVLNKTDRLDAGRIASRIAAAAELGEFHSLHPVSALTGDGLEELLHDVASLMPEGPAYFPPGVVSDQTDEERIAELIREAALRLTRDEVPHSLAAMIEEVEPSEGGVDVVRATLICETESQKGILIGRHGSMIKRIGSDARPHIERILGGRSYLELRVKVRPRWRRDEAALDRLGV
jgi:GTP-binding protein Era